MRGDSYQKQRLEGAGEGKRRNLSKKGKAVENLFALDSPPEGKGGEKTRGGSTGREKRGTSSPGKERRLRR